ncbi:MAG: hypothetical protein ABGW98_08085 [Myxococcales bacterium]
MKRHAPSQKWIIDITYFFWASAGWVYFSTVMDLLSTFAEQGHPALLPSAIAND